MGLLCLCSGFLLYLIFQTTSCQEYVHTCLSLNDTTILATNEPTFIAYPNSTHPNSSEWIDCEFRIEAPSGSVILVNFSRFDTNFRNRIAVFDDDETSAGVFTNTYSSSPSYISKTNSLIYRQVADHDYTGNGYFGSFQIFTEELRSSTERCGGRTLATMESKEIYSPAWPYFYIADQTCTRRIVQPDGGRIRINFHLFELESEVLVKRFPELPGRDVLIIYDDEVEVERYNYSSMPTNYTSTSSTVKLFFSSDKFVGGQGFIATVQATCDSFGERTIHAITNPKTITSPNWPYPPGPESAECEYTINAPHGQSILFIFSEFNVTFPDRVSVYDKNLTSSTILFNTYDVPPTFISNTNEVIFKIATTEDFTGAGFVATFQIFTPDLQSLAAPCGFTKRATRRPKSINSPNWPYWYGGSQSCTWTLFAHEGERIQIVFEEFELENGFLVNLYPEAPGDDVLIIYENDVETVRYDYQSKPTEYTSTSNEVRLVFTTDNMVSGPGFSATYRSRFSGSLFQRNMNI